MRLEVDRELGKILDEIKKKEHSIYGRGHVETVRFLAKYYDQHKPLQQLTEDLEINLTHFLENLNPNIERSLDVVFRKALSNVISNVLVESDSGNIADPSSVPSYSSAKKEISQSSEHPNELRNSLFQLLGGKCLRCGETDWRCLQIDHVNGGGSKEKKACSSSRAYLRAVFKKIRAGSKEYQLLCANCNWRKLYEKHEYKPDSRDADPPGPGMDLNMEGPFK